MIGKEVVCDAHKQDQTTDIIDRAFGPERVHDRG
jgi:hypothetical protein